MLRTVVHTSGSRSEFVFSVRGSVRGSQSTVRGSRFARRALQLPHARRVGAAPGDLDRLAAPRARLARQARADPLGVRRDRARHRRARAGRDPLSRRRRARERPRRARRARACARERVRLHVVPTDRVWLRDYGADRRHRRARRGAPRSTGGSTPGRSTPTGSTTRRSAAAIAASPGCRASEPRRRRHRRARSCSRAAASTSTARACCSSPRSGCSADVQVRNPGPDARRLRAHLREYLGIRRDDLAGRRLRRRRHARPRRRPRAVRRRRTRRARGRGRPARREPRSARSTTCGASSGSRATGDAGPLAS